MSDASFLTPGAADTSVTAAFAHSALPAGLLGLPAWQDGLMMAATPGARDSAARDSIAAGGGLAEGLAAAAGPLGQA